MMKRTRVGALLAFFALGAFVLAGCGDDNGGGGGNEMGPGAPAAPSNVSVTNDSTVATVSWTAPDNATSQTVEITNGTSESQDVGGGAESAEFTGLTPDTDYTGTITASNSEGTSDPADFSFTTDPVQTGPQLNFNNQLVDPELPDAAFSIGTQGSPPNFIPASAPSGFTALDAATLNGAPGLVTGSQQLVTAEYPGAVEPGTALADAWYNGWTVWTVDGSDSRPTAVSAGDPGVAVLTDTIRENRTLSSDTTYLIDGTTFVGVDCGIDGNAAECDRATLTIEPGTTIAGLETPTGGGRASTLVVTRGSDIVADALDANCDPSVSARPTEAQTIVFTSNRPQGQRQRGDWGGLVINGRAPINTGDEAQGEGDSGLFGGNAPDDDSGCVRGVRVEFAGDNFTAEDQLNGIAFQGTGAATLVDYLQVHYNQDDGIEPFGGTVAVTHSVMTGIGDDSYDGTDGWQGFWQFGIAQQRADDADQGFEISNNGESSDASPHSSGVVSNFTVVGAGVDLGTGEIAAEGSSSDVGVLFREGSNFRLFNVIATGFGASGFDVEGAQAAVNADNLLDGQTDPASTLRFEHSILWANVTASPGDSDDNFIDASADGYTQQENEDFFLTGQDSQ